MSAIVDFKSIKTGDKYTHPQFSLIGTVMRTHAEMVEVKFGPMRAWFTRRFQRGFHEAKHLMPV